MAEVGPATSFGDLLKEARRRLAEAGVEEAALDARLLVEHFTGTTRTDAIVAPERKVGADAAAATMQAVTRRAVGEPVHRILGFREFHGLTLKLNADTLEPRPDTEALVDLVAPLAAGFVASTGECRILDLGTGTGAIALALLKEVPGANALATDISPQALAMAAANADINAMSERFSTLESDWFAAVAGDFHIIVANPPYIPSRDLADLQREVRLHDPRRALDGGADGLDAYRKIAQGAAAHLVGDGMVAVEIGSSQKNDVEAVFAGAGYGLAELGHDLAGHERALLFRLRDNNLAGAQKELGNRKECG